MLEDLDIKYGNTYDVKLSETSTNAVQNQVVTKKFKELDDKNTRTDNELTNIKSSVNTALSNSKSYTDLKISETKIQIDSELNKKANQTDIDEVVDVLNENINLKVDKVPGKGLSTNDFNDNYKSKLDNLNSSLNSALTSAKSYTNSEITKIDNKINSEISRAQISESNLSGRINDLEEDLVDALQEAKEYTDSLANGEVKNNTNKINTLNGTGEGSVIKTVKDEISNLVGTAPEKLDTLQEIAEYLEEHEDMASGLVNSLSELEAKKADKTELNNLKTETDSALQSLEKSKANNTGYYPQMSVGQADNLPDRGDVTEGFIGFRESAGAGNSIEDGTANVVELLGESLVWNQKLKGFASWNLQGGTIEGNEVVWSASNRTGALDAYSNTFAQHTTHKYLISADVKASSTNVGLGMYYTGSPLVHHSGSGQYERLAVITQGKGDGTDACYLTDTSTSGFGEIRAKNYRCMDLTQMFQAGNEPATIEEFEARKNQLVGVDFNAYNEGEVLGVNIKGFKSVNDNAWDEEWQNGFIYGEGEVSNDGTSGIISKNFIPVLANEEYYYVYPQGAQYLSIVYYDHSKHFVSQEYLYASNVRRTPTNAAYIKFFAEGVPTYNHDICVSLYHSGYKTDYVAHEESESSFDLTKYFPNGMHGLNGVRDSATPKKTTRRFVVVDLGDLDWYEGGGFFASEGVMNIIKSASSYSEIGNMICTKYITDTWGRIYNGTTSNAIGVSIDGQIGIIDSSYTDAASFKAAMKGVPLYYELATPIETEIDPQLNMNYKVWDFGTEQLLTDSKSAPVLARTIYGFNATDTIRGNKATNEEQDARLHTLESEVVRKGDYSPDNSVGFADDLVGRGESVPAEFSFRASGGKSIKDGTAWIKRLKGNSVVWNQKASFNTLVDSLGIAEIADIEGGKMITLTQDYTGSADYDIRLAYNGQLIAGHVYCVSMETYSSKGGRVNMDYSGSIANRGDIPANTWSLVAAIGVAASDKATFSIYPNFKSVGYLAGDTFGVRNVRVIDLTQLFQAGNEPTTIEEFYARKPIVEDEYAYNEGEVIHMTAEGIKSVGDNAWDEEWEVGGVNYLTGENFNTSSQIRSINYVKVIPSESYFFKMPTNYTAAFYNDKKVYIGGIGKSTSQVIQLPSNCHYLRFSTGSSVTPVTSYNHDIMITLVHSGWKQDTDAKYQPYWEDRLMFDQRIKDEFPDGMKSAGTAHDVAYNDMNKGVGVTETRIGVVDMGDLTFTELQDGMYAANLADMAIRGQILCAKYNTDTYTNVTAQTMGIASLLDKGGIVLYDSAYTTPSAIKASLQGVMLYYELAEPTIIEYDEPFNLDYRVADFGTEQAIVEQPSAPISADIIYQFNAVDMIREHELEIEELKTTIVNLQTLITQLQTSISSMGG